MLTCCLYDPKTDFSSSKVVTIGGNVKESYDIWPPCDGRDQYGNLESGSTDLQECLELTDRIRKRQVRGAVKS